MSVALEPNINHDKIIIFDPNKPIFRPYKIYLKRIFIKVNYIAYANFENNINLKNMSSHK